MSKREKIIVVVMAVAVLYGAYVFLFEGKTTKSSGKKVSLKDLNQYVLTVASSLPQKTALDTENYIVKTAKTPWRINPFIELEEKKPQDETEVVIDAKPDVTIIYSGFIELGGKKLAIINGFEYEEGEPLEAAGYFVESIFPKEVIIGVSGSRQKYRVKLEETY